MIHQKPSAVFHNQKRAPLGGSTRRQRRRPTWGIHAHYRRIDRRVRCDWRRWRETLRAGLERDTGLMPWIVAETVCEEVGCFFDLELPSRYPLWLDVMAEHYYARDEEFRREMRAGGNRGRDSLYAFMRHWINALFFHERPDLECCLPPEFSIGRPLPRGPQPRTRRRSYGPLPPPRAWDARRILKNDNWHWLERLLRQKLRKSELDVRALNPAAYESVTRELYGLTNDEIIPVKDSK
jgi:hypothetical protein